MALNVDVPIDVDVDVNDDVEVVFGFPCGRRCVDGARIFDPEPDEPEPERILGTLDEPEAIPGVVVLLLVLPPPAEAGARARGGARDVDELEDEFDDASGRDLASMFTFGLRGMPTDYSLVRRISITRTRS